MRAPERGVGRPSRPAPGPSSAARIRSGVAGSSVIQAPTASWMAATTAGAPTSIGSSPTPFAPCGAPLNGASTRIVVIARRVERGRDEVRREPVVEVAPVLELDLLDRRVADRLERAALDLALAQDRVDDPADVVDGDDVADGHLAGVEVDVDRRDAGRPAEGGVGIAAVRRVVELDARVRLEQLVDAGRVRGPPRRRGRPPRRAARRCAPRPRPAAVARRRCTARRRPSPCGSRRSVRCRGRRRCRPGPSRRRRRAGRARPRP